ncbi:MAG: zinc-binding alcohol dehydrogenase family protein [Proteobacteria bacterium]|nr:zinc-binding alcohol dehydrogenase family protein [Burkholderiales bacterium]
MKAVGYRRSLPIDDPESLIDVTVDDPRPGARDLLVEVRAISVNPVDTKMRMRAAPAPGATNVLGWDAAGIVREVGTEVSLFRRGDEVFYAGAIQRPGTNAQLHAVDERIVGRKPASLDFAQAAALPLTSITAWELLFDRLGATRRAAGAGDGTGNPAASSRRTLLITGAAGGVGSMLVQLARQLTDLTVVGTASREETAQWVRALGAHAVIDHSKPLAGELARAGIGQIDLVASLTHTDEHFAALVEAMAPQGKFALIDDPKTAPDVMSMKRKSLSLHWELMFTRALFETPDMIEQHRLLNEVSRLVDAGVLRTTLTETLGVIDAATLRRAHALIEGSRARGKLVLSGFS